MSKNSSYQKLPSQINICGRQPQEWLLAVPKNRTGTKYDQIRLLTLTLTQTLTLTPNPSHMMRIMYG